MPIGNLFFPFKPRLNVWTLLNQSIYIYTHNLRLLYNRDIRKLNDIWNNSKVFSKNDTQAHFI